MADLISQYVNFDQSFAMSAGFILFNPTFWNIVGQLEFKTHFMRKIFGSKQVACYVFAVIIFSLGIGRDLVFNQALKTQPSIELNVDPMIPKVIAGALMAIGQTLVLAAYYRLGIDGTYCGDYFGILKSEKITGFPFSVTSDPMYLGSSLTFLGHAIWNLKPAGVLMAVYVYIVYKVYAELLEGPFTDYIYSEAAKKKAQQQKKAKKDN